jgi:hypothetical protein
MEDMIPVFTSFTKFSQGTGAVLAFSLALLTPLSTAANGLGENNPWRFTHKDKVRMLEIQELKNSGYYDAQGGATNAGGDTIINGDQINCMVQSTAFGNSATNDLTATTGSLTGISDSEISSDSEANDANMWSDGDSDLDIGQENTGDVHSSVNDSGMSSNVGTFNGGGTSDQDVTTSQNADNSTITSTIDNVTVCDGMTIN